MMGFLSVVAILGALGALGGGPGSFTGHFVSLRAGWIVLTISAVAPLVLKISDSVNPAFGGWIVIAVPYWSGVLISAGYLAYLSLNKPLNLKNGNPQ